MATEKPISEAELKYKGLTTKDLITSTKTYGKDKVIIHRNLRTIQDYVQERRSNGFSVNIFAPQPGTQEQFLANKASIKILHGNRGGGKLQPYGTDVYTPNGIVKIEYLKVGDIIFNPNGEYQIVEEIFEHKNKDIYEFTFIDGSKAESGLEHLWLAKITSSTIKSSYGYRKYDDLNFTGKVMTTKEIIDFLDWKKSGDTWGHKNKNICIPRCNALEFSDEFYNKYKRPFSPYILGVLIGDGSISHNSIQWVKPEGFIAEKIYQMGYEVNQLKSEKKYSITGNGGKKIKEGLKYVGLMGCRSWEKFIPDCYKYAPIPERIELLQGLMDTDGSTDDRGHIEYSTTSERLANDIQWVIRSLGGKCTIRTKETKFTYKGEKREGRLAYRLYIQMEDQSILFSLPRKKQNLIGYKYNGGVSERLNRIISYRYVGKKDARCITVSGDNKLYVTDDFIVTHNTVVLGMEALKMADKPNYSALVFRKDKTSAEKADGILKVISGMLEQYGEYLDSKRLSRLDAGGEVRYDYFGDACIGGEGGVQAFFDRQQGANVTKVFIDECAQATEPIINYLQTVLRSATGLKTCLCCAANPNPYSEYWRALVDWWVDDDGMAIPERSGKIRYYFQYGDTIKETVWGNTPEEVFNEAKDYIIARFGRNKIIDETNCHNYIKNITFIASDLEDNKIMLNSNPDYEKNLGGTAQEVSINALGSWKLIKGGNEWITRAEMEEFFNNEPQYDDNFRCATLDIAYGYGDMIVMAHWIGHHLQDLQYSSTVKPKELYGWVRNNLLEWDLGENRLAFDGLGAPMFRDEFPDSYAILRAVEKDSTKRKSDQPVKVYFDLRSQLADYMVSRLKGVVTEDNKCGFSINPELLDKPYKNTTVREEFLKQRRAILRDVERENGKLRLLQKKDAKKIVGSSPDLIEGTLLYRSYFDVCNVFMPIEEDIFDNLKWC